MLPCRRLTEGGEHEYIRDMRIVRSFRERVRRLSLQINVLHHAGRHPDLPLLSRFLVLLTVAYALSPVDLIPDFIPILGYLDDLILLPLLIFLSIRSIPEHILSEAREQAANEPFLSGRNWRAGAVIIAIWISISFCILWNILS